MNPNIIIDSFNKAGQTVHIVKPEEGKLGLPVLLDYIKAEKATLDQLFRTAGAILFRGFDIHEKEDFLQIKELYAGASNFDYVDGNSPRTKLSTAVYTSTEYPQELRIPLHSEMSYSNKWPEILFFFCKTPSAEGGETPVADCRLILNELSSEIVSNFENYGVKYTRYLSGKSGMGKTWMDTFESSDKSVIEKYCQENGVEYFWEKEALFIGQSGVGVARHPITKEKVWFNQANQFHPSGLPEEVYKGLKLLYSKNTHRFPQYAFYGDRRKAYQRNYGSPF
jgi:hypothetical protein